MNRLNIEYESRQDLSILLKMSNDISSMFESTERFSSSLIEKGIIWNFSSKREKIRDYLSLAEMSDENIKKSFIIESIILIRDNKVVFERGPALDSDIPAWPNDINEVVNSKSSEYWVSSRKMNYYFYKDQNDGVLAKYKVLSSIDGKATMVLFIGFDEIELCSHYNIYANGLSYLVDDNGKILSSVDKKSIGSFYTGKNFRKFVDDQGFFQTKDGFVVIYVRGYNNWYLINHIPLNNYDGSKKSLLLIVFIAALLGGCFALSCLVMQKLYIFNPLKRMLFEMNQIKEGNLNIKMSYQSNDEIGQINREVEQIFMRLNDLIHEVYISKIYSQEATLKMLESQINPHFLFNTLDSIHWKALINKDIEVADQIEALSDLFRHMLTGNGNDMVSLDQEVEQLKNFLYIMNFRYDNRIKCMINIEKGMENIKMPKLLLQPIVENSIRHGIEPKAEEGEIQINIKKVNKELLISIKDNGIGVNADEINKILKSEESSSNVFALKNVDKRIKLRYGEKYGLKFSSSLGVGTEVILVLPVEKAE
jgi:two-component system sensor histidine kinase YesM